jgi:hypothetical protein
MQDARRHEWTAGPGRRTRLSISSECAAKPTTDHLLKARTSEPRRHIARRGAIRALRVARSSTGRLVPSRAADRSDSICMLSGSAIDSSSRWLMCASRLLVQAHLALPRRGLCMAAATAAIPIRNLEGAGCRPSQ